MTTTNGNGHSVIWQRVQVGVALAILLWLSSSVEGIKNTMSAMVVEVRRLRVDFDKSERRRDKLEDRVRALENGR